MDNNVRTGQDNVMIESRRNVFPTVYGHPKIIERGFLNVEILVLINMLNFLF